MTQKQARKLCREWQRRLRLQDWQVELSFRRFHEMSGDTRGDCYMSMEQRIARIDILNPKDARPDAPPYDLEQTIVHELLHLHFEPFWRNKKRLELEQAIEAIAFALVAAKRVNLTAKPKHP